MTFGGELLNSELLNGELLNGELLNGELLNGELLNGELLNGELLNGELLNGELPNGELLNSELPNSDLSILLGQRVIGLQLDIIKKSKEPQPTRENLHGVNAKTCLQALRTQFKEFLASKGVNATDLLNQVDAGLVVTESSGTKPDKQDTSSSSGNYTTQAVDGRYRQKPDISFLHVFGALCYLKNDREDLGKLGAKGDIRFFISYSANSYAFRVYNRRTKKIMETMNVTFDELSAMDFEQRSSKPGLQGMTFGQIISGLDLTYASSTITSQKPTEHDLDLLLKQSPLQPETVADNVSNAMLDGNTFVNPFATPSTDSDESSSHYVDPSNMHTFYQPYPHEYQWTKDHPLEQVIGEPSRSVLTRNQLYALTVSTMEPSNVKQAMIDPSWIDLMQEELLQFKPLDVWELVPLLDNVKALTLKWLFKNKHDEENTIIRNKTRLVVRGYRQEEVLASLFCKASVLHVN
ncbi:retrovirus-related pol polyprotein from transposon TNT 1-94 [Tanacetum coccineum]